MPTNSPINPTDNALTFDSAEDAKTSPRGVSYREAGKGPPVLLLHAFPLASAMWREQIRALQGNYHVAAPDVRGFGSTPAFTGPPSVDQMADDAAALLDELNITGPIVVGGLSMGGYVALAFARRHAARLRALVLADTRAEPDDAAGRANRDKMIEFASKNPSKAVIEQMLPKMVCAETLQKRPEVVEAVKHFASLQAPAGIVNALEGAARSAGRYAVPSANRRADARRRRPRRRPDAGFDRREADGRHSRSENGHHREGRPSLQPGTARRLQPGRPRSWRRCERRMSPKNQMPNRLRPATLGALAQRPSLFWGVFSCDESAAAPSSCFPCSRLPAPAATTTLNVTVAAGKYDRSGTPVSQSLTLPAAFADLKVVTLQDQSGKLSAVAPADRPRPARQRAGAGQGRGPP